MSEAEGAAGDTAGEKATTPVETKPQDESTSPPEEATTADTPPKEAKEIKPKKVVRIVVPPQTPKNQISDTKVHMGKANPWRELGMPLSFLFFAILFCWGMSDIGTHVAQHPNKLSLLETMSAQRAEQKFNKRGGYSAPNCQLFLAKSILPGAGYGIFVGKDYQEGDTVVLPGKDFVAVQEDLAIAQPAFLLKHHHRLNNIEGNTVQVSSVTRSNEPLKFKATRPIRAGEELFLPFDNHPQSQIEPNSNLFQYIPRENQFNTAEEIMRDMVARFHWKKGRETKGNQIEETLHLIHRIAKRLDATVARFLPTTKTEMDRWIKEWKDGVPFEALALTRKSIQGLQMNARCLEYVMEHPQSATTTFITKQKTSKGTVVAPIPFYVQPLSKEQTCPTNGGEEGECSPDTITSTSCLQTGNLPFALCSLSLPSWILPVDGTEANVDYRWNRGDSHNEKSHAMSAEQVMKQYTTELSLDLVALRDLEPGEVLRVGSGVEDIIPEQWKAAM